MESTKGVLFMQGRNKSDAARTTMICVDSYKQSIMAGRYYNYGQEGEGHQFCGLMQLLADMEQILDSANFPQSFTAVRSFADAAEAKQADAAESAAQKGRCATFEVKILFRQHTSWQGSVKWLEKNSEQPFRSALELIFLMNSALECSAE